MHKYVAPFAENVEISLMGIIMASGEGGDDGEGGSTSTGCPDQGGFVPYDTQSLV